MSGENKTIEKRNEEKEVVQKPRTVNLQLSEGRLRRLQEITAWEQQSAESMKFRILGEPSGYFY
ncbi:MAG: hypothetical protein ABH886_09195 [Candidatus Desantisbacteria bacterium]